MQLFDRGCGPLGIDCEVRAAGTGGVLGEGVPGVLGVHGVRGGEGQAGAPRAAEGLEDVEHDLVGAVGGPDPRGVQPPAGLGGQVVGQGGAQVREVALGVAVQTGGGLGHSSGDGLDDRGRGRVGVLVDVEPYGHVEFGCSVGRLALKAGAQG